MVGRSKKPNDLNPVLARGEIDFLSPEQLQKLAANLNFTKQIKCSVNGSTINIELDISVPRSNKKDFNKELERLLERVNSAVQHAKERQRKLDRIVSELLG
jgi:peptidoglycan hydrolase CwlO-like protein